jgi:dTDP-4-amino-4,6-dideoxygalactose transaminase
MKNLKYRSHKNTALIADDVMKNGILLGCHQALSKNDLKRMCNLFLKFTKIKGI